MIFLRKFSILFAVVLAGSVDANHIKRHHFPARNQCRPRLIETHTAPVHEISVTHSHPSTLIWPYHSSSTKTVLLPTSTASSLHVTSIVTSAPKSSGTSTRSPSSTLIQPSESHEISQTSSSTKVVQLPSTSSTLVTSATADVTAISTAAAKSLVPNNVKAGIAGGDAYTYMQDHIGWWYDWSPNPSKPGKPIAVPMLWGNGTDDQQDAERLTAFEQITSDPPFVLGYEEPDCPSGDGSAGMSVKDGVQKWESLIAPMKAKGTKLGSPSMCKQADETWLAQFETQITTQWDFTAIHINKNSIDGVKKDISHYMKYNKPIWVTEFACVDDNEKFEPCTNQDQINQFINDIVDFMETNSTVYAYAYSNGLGLGDIWPLMKDNSLSESGKTYLAAISKYH